EPSSSCTRQRYNRSVNLRAVSVSQTMRSHVSAQRRGPFFSLFSLSVFSLSLSLSLPICLPPSLSPFYLITSFFPLYLLLLLPSSPSPSHPSPSLPPSLSHPLPLSLAPFSQAQTIFHCHASTQNSTFSTNCLTLFLSFFLCLSLSHTHTHTHTL